MSLSESSAHFAKADAVKSSWVFADKSTKYFVPDYQRHYVWREPQVIRFVRSVLLAPDWYTVPDVKSLPPRFLGCLVFWVRSGARNVIDGQQRITTLSLVFAVLRDMLVAENQPGLAATVAEALYVDGGLLEQNRPLRLASLGATAGAYEKIVRSPQSLDDDERGSAVAIAYRAIRDEFEELLHKATETNPQLGRVELISRIHWRFMHAAEFAVLLAHSEVDAYTLFDSLNTPGVPLDTGDRLKNKLLSRSDRHGVQDVYEDIVKLWKDLEDNLSPATAGDFLHAYWRAFHEYVPDRDLYDAIVRHLDALVTPFEVRQFLKRLVAAAKHFAKSYSPQVQAGMDGPLRMAYRVQNELGARTARPLMLWVAVNRKTEELAVARLCEVIAARQIFTNSRSQPFNKAFNDVLTALRQGDSRDVCELVYEKFAPVVPGDQEFVRAVRRISCRSTTGKVQWLLRRLNDSYGSTEHDLSTKEVHVEHILAKAATPAAREEARADALSDSEFEKLTGMLGNVTLLFGPVNVRLKNRPVSEKLPEYKSKCDLKMTRELLKSSMSPFTVARIKERTAALAKRAAQVWKWPPQ